MQIPVLKLPANTQGKDYVIGDLHGCYDLLETLFAAVTFDTQKDRLFSVGDLVDRGPKSLRCLQLLVEPWFYAVMGNHEQMMLDFFADMIDAGGMIDFELAGQSDYFFNGGNWVGHYYQPAQQRMSEDLLKYLPRVKQMPQVIIVGEGRQRFNLVHAELIKSNHGNSSQLVWLDQDLDRWAHENRIPTATYDRLLWGRYLMWGSRHEAKFDTLQTGLSTTFCGHTPCKLPTQILSHLCIDTGAYLTLDGTINEGYGLTLFAAQEKTWLKTSYQGKQLTRGSLALANYQD